MLPATMLALGNRDVAQLLLLGSNGGGVSLGLLPHGSAEIDNFLVDHLAHLGDVLDDFEVEIEGRGTGGFVRGVVPDVKVGVLEGLLDGNTRGGVEGEHAVEEVEGVRVGVGEESVEGDLGHEGEVADVFLGAGGADAAQGFFVGGAQVVQDLVELVDVITALEEGAAAEEFGQDTADGPHVN